jgi:hypothetical protein
MNIAALARTRVYQDAATNPSFGFKPEEEGAREIYIRLDRVGIIDAMEQTSIAANSKPHEIDDVRRDAQTAVAAARQLEFVMTQLYEEPLPDLKMAEGVIIDINRDVPPGAATFLYYLYTGRAMARFSGSWSGGNSIMTTLVGAEKSGKTESITAGYAYTMQDLRRAGFMNLPLDTMLAKYDRRGHMRLKHDTGLWGRMDLGLPGLVKHPNITVVDAPLNAGSSSTYWSAKTAAEIMVDIGTLANTTGESTEGMRQTTHIWLPRAEYNLIAGMMITSLATMTVLQWAKQIYPGIEFGILDDLAAPKSIDQWGVQHLATDAALALVKNKDVVSLVDPMDYTQYPVQYVDLKAKIPTESMTGGVMLKEPFTVVRLDGIGLTPAQAS